MFWQGRAAPCRAPAEKIFSSRVNLGKKIVKGRWTAWVSSRIEEVPMSAHVPAAPAACALPIVVALNAEWRVLRRTAVPEVWKAQPPFTGLDDLKSIMVVLEDRSVDFQRKDELLLALIVEAAGTDAEGLLARRVLLQTMLGKAVRIARSLSGYYTKAGGITAVNDLQNAGAGSTQITTDLQCFSHDYAQRLTAAWTDKPADLNPPAGSVGTDPAGGGTGTVASRCTGQRAGSAQSGDQGSACSAPTREG
jgi:hypothetical protein